METLLTIAIIMTALAVVVQAGVLVAMYLMSRRLANDVNSLIADTRRIITPLENIATNFKTASDDLIDISKTAREELHRVQTMMKDTAESVRGEIADVRSRINETVDDMRSTVIKPFREWAAIAHGLTEGIRTFFRRRPVRAREREYPAA
jgi:ElaB/YqjD/DUF883 family membrane-anchored ribosome-binding protein